MTDATTYYKAVDSSGLSFFPFEKSKRVNWIDLIGTTHALTNDDAWNNAVEKLRKGDTICCTEYLMHGYADIALAIDFGERNIQGRADEDKGFRIVAFEGEPVAQLEGALLLTKVPWDKEQRARFPDVVKYGFRSVYVEREVPEDEW